VATGSTLRSARRRITAPEDPRVSDEDIATGSSKKKREYLQDLLGFGAGALIYWWATTHEGSLGKIYPSRYWSWKNGAPPVGNCGCSAWVSALTVSNTHVARPLVTVKRKYPAMANGTEGCFKQPFANQNAILFRRRWDMTFKTDANGKAEVKVSDIKGLATL
jgi:hypothetical protein